MATILRSAGSAFFPLSPGLRRAGSITVLVCLTAPLSAAPQQPDTASPVSVHRIRAGLAKPPPPQFDLPIQVPIAKFTSSVEQRVYVIPLNEWINKEFKLTELQRQSGAWAGGCCGGFVLASGAYGIRLDPLIDQLQKALKRRKERKTREQIARELAHLEAARKKQ